MSWRVSREFPPHHHQPEPLIYDRMDRSFHVVYTKLYATYYPNVADSSDQVTFAQF